MTLPSRERIEELRAARQLADWSNWCEAYLLANDELLALLDSALVLRRLEEWLRGERALGMCLDFQRESGTISAELEMQVTGYSVEAGPDLLSALRAALDKAGAP